MLSTPSAQTISTSADRPRRDADPAALVEPMQVVMSLCDDIKRLGIEFVVVSAQQRGSNSNATTDGDRKGSVSWTEVDGAMSKIQRYGGSVFASNLLLHHLTDTFKASVLDPSMAALLSAVRTEEATTAIQFLLENKYIACADDDQPSIDLAGTVVTDEELPCEAHRGTILAALPPLQDIRKNFNCFESVVGRAETLLRVPNMSLTFTSSVRCLVTNNKPWMDAVSSIMAVTTFSCMTALGSGAVVEDSLHEVLGALHGLTLLKCSEVLGRARSVIKRVVQHRVEGCRGETATAGQLAGLRKWKRSVVDGFLNMSRLGDSRAIGAWCHAVHHELHTLFGKLRISEIFDIAVEYPDSEPALLDLNECLRGDHTLHNEFITVATQSLSKRLLHAGARTEDVLTVLISMIKCICVAFPSTIAGSVVHASCDASLKYLRRRPDAVTAVVRSITQSSSGDELLRRELETHTLHGTGPSGEGGDESDADDLFVNQDDDELGKFDSPARARNVRHHQDPEDGEGGFSTGQPTRNLFGDGQPSESPNRRGGALPATGPGRLAISRRFHQKPDVLRILLSALSVPVIVKEYRHLLAASLLETISYDVDHPAEVLERVKCIFGEEALSDCAVMLRDVQQSKRANAALLTQRPQLKPTKALILSATCWPTPLYNYSTTPADRHLYATRATKGETSGLVRLHPALEAHMTAYNEEFAKFKAGRKLKYVDALSSVVLRVSQEENSGSITKVSYEVPLVAASIVLHLTPSLDGVSQEKATGGDTNNSNSTSGSVGGKKLLTEVAKLMGTTVEIVHQRVVPLVPRLFVLHDGDEFVSLQTKVVKEDVWSAEARTVVGGGAAGGGKAGADGGDGLPGGFTAEDNKKYSTLVSMMLKSGGQKSVTQIENSMRMFGQFAGTTDQVKALLQHMVREGKVVPADNNTYAAK